MILSILFLAHSAMAVDAKDAVASIVTQLKKDSLIVNVNPPSGTELNFEGPWNLTINDPNGAKSSFDLANFDKSAHKFSVLVPDKKMTNYKVTYFLCATDHTWCKRDVKEGVIR